MVDKDDMKKLIHKSALLTGNKLLPPDTKIVEHVTVAQFNDHLERDKHDHEELLRLVEELRGEVNRLKG